jgi:hypothetical protein
MNIFSSLNPEINDEEIDGEKEYRKVKKKIRRLNEKDLLTEEQEEKLKIFKILVEEYESRHKGIPEKKPQAKKKQKKQKKTKGPNKEEEELLNREYEKNRNYWKKKEREDLERELRQKWQKEQEERERKLKEEWEREHKQKEQQHKWEQQRQRNNYNYQKQYYTHREKSPEEKFCENYDIEVPQDIKDLYRNYSTKKYRELALKYHPDKGNKNIEYQKMINNIKDIFK